MKYLHTMLRIKDIDESLDFFCNKLGLQELRRHENEGSCFTLIFLAAHPHKSPGSRWRIQVNGKQ